MLVYLKRISKARPSTSLTAIVALLTGPPTTRPLAALGLIFMVEAVEAELGAEAKSPPIAAGLVDTI